MASTTMPPAGHEEEIGGPATRWGSKRALVRIGRFVGHSLPTYAIVCALVALAYWGHHSDWGFLNFSAASSPIAASSGWCEEHNVPEAECIECRKELVPLKDYGWCSTHGVHNCPLHHPEVAERKPAPEISPARLEQAARALAVKERPQNNSRCTLYQRRVQFASKEAMTKAGVDVALVEETPLLETIAASGALSYNETRVASLSSRSAGTIWRVLKQVGERVQEGELLALVDAARVGKAKADFLQALVRWRLASATQKRLHRISDTIAGKQLLEAESELRSAQVSLLSAQQALVNLGLPVTAEDFQGDSESAIAQKIQFLGLPRELSTTLDASSTTANLLPIIAPFPGVVTQRDVVAGEVVDEAKSLFVIVDPSTMWLMLSVPQEQVQYLQLGQEVRFQPDQSGAPARGTVTWISTEVDQDTRTVRARAEVSNRDGRLRANLFGEGQIVLRQETSAVTVPNEAVQWDGSCNVVFVRDRDFFKKGSPKFFHVRTIRPGVRTSEGTEVIVGLLPGEVIATKGSGVLLAQLQKSNLGAGCCGND